MSVCVCVCVCVFMRAYVCMRMCLSVSEHTYLCIVLSYSVAQAQEMFGSRLEARVTPVGDNSILFEQCDIVSPCAFGGVLNTRTIPCIQAAIITGAANNQLEVPSDAELLRSITYVPDFVANRMGMYVHVCVLVCVPWGI